MSKRVGTPNGRRAPWKHRVKAARRADAEARQKIYDAKPLEAKLKTAGKRERTRLLQKQVTK